MSLTRGLVLDVANQVGGAMPSIVTLHDWSRYQNDGAMANVTWVQLPTGLWVMDFNGATSLVNCGNDGSLMPVTGLTILVWTYLRTLTNWDELLAKSSNAILNGYGITNISAAAGWRCWVNHRVNNIVFVVPTLNVWQQIALTYNKVVVEAYRNAVSQGTDNYTADIVTNTSNLVVGASLGGGPFDGNIALLRIYNYALTPAQIRARYHSQKWLFGVAS